MQATAPCSSPPNPNPARIINISFGGSAACGAAYQQAIDDVRAAPGGGAVVVAAAGNEWSAPTRPASCQRAVGVAALNRDGFKSNYSSFGAAIALATVGGDDNDGAWGPALADSGVLTIGNDGLTVPTTDGYYYHFGTSFSAPIVAGAASLMLSLNPALTVDQIIAGLKASARPHVELHRAGLRPVQRRQPGPLPVHDGDLRRRHARRDPGLGLCRIGRARRCLHAAELATGQSRQHSGVDCRSGRRPRPTRQLASRRQRAAVVAGR